jgi:hypothetical protein
LKFYRTLNIQSRIVNQFLGNVRIGPLQT